MQIVSTFSQYIIEIQVQAMKNLSTGACRKLLSVVAHTHTHTISQGSTVLQTLYQL